jgi:hypothetical protein
MKLILIVATLIASLGGCAIVPIGYGYGDSRDGYYRERGYDRGEGNYRGYGYRGGDDRSGYRDHG